MMDFVFNSIGFAVEQWWFYFSLDRAPSFGFFSPKYNLIMQGREGLRWLVKLVSRFMILWPLKEWGDARDADAATAERRRLPSVFFNGEPVSLSRAKWRDATKWYLCSKKDYDGRLSFLGIGKWVRLRRQHDYEGHGSHRQWSNTTLCRRARRRFRLGNFLKVRSRGDPMGSKNAT